jgi:phosphate transport system substrate-binding protein
MRFYGITGARLARFLGLFIVSTLTALAGVEASASGNAAPAPAITPGPVLWPLQASPAVKPQSDEEKKLGQQVGRALPVPELLQPSVDSRLSPFVPTSGLKIDRHFRAGASDILPALVEAWVAGFRNYFPGFALEIDKPLAGSLGARELIGGRVDMVFVSRELKPIDISDFRDRYGYDPLSVPISGGSYRHFGFLDALAFMVHRDNPIERLSFRQLDAILSSTRHRGGDAVRTWGDLGLGGEWAKRPINVYGIKPWNGIEEFVRQRVLSVPGKRGEWRDDIHFDPVFFPVARRVAADPSSLGYTGLSVVDSAVKVIMVGGDDGDEAYAPSYEAVASAAYPLSRLIYLNTNREPGKPLEPAMNEFLRFILSRDGQDIVRKHAIFLPLRSEQVASSLALLSE